MKKRRPRLKPEAGQRYGRWTAIAKFDDRSWRFVCDCGTEKNALTANVVSGKSKSCGCYRTEIRRTHGLSHTKEYKVWSGMVERCANPNRNGYEHYGGRGIRVCERWLNFVNFYEDVGPIPDGATLDRINVNGDYEPGNLRFASWSTQRRNKRSSKTVALANATIAELELALALKRAEGLFG